MTGTGTPQRTASANTAGAAVHWYPNLRHRNGLRADGEWAILSPSMRFLAVPVILLVSAFSAFAADISGMWQLTIETPNGKAESSIELMQEDGKLTGVIQNEYGIADIEGTIKDNDMSFTRKVMQNGKAVTVATFAGKIAYSGKAESFSHVAFKISGTFKLYDGSQEPGPQKRSRLEAFARRVHARFLIPSCFFFDALQIPSCMFPHSSVN